MVNTADGVTTRYPQVFDELTNGVVTRTYTYGLQRVSEARPANNTWTALFAAHMPFKDKVAGSY